MANNSRNSLNTYAAVGAVGAAAGWSNAVQENPHDMWSVWWIR